MKQSSVLTILLLLSSFNAYSEITDEYRKSNAIVLYDFKDTNGNVIQDKSVIGEPLNLYITDASTSAIDRQVGSIELKSRNLISSAAPATKIINACKASGELSVEVWVENNDPAQPTVGQYPDKTPQPNRIISLSTNLIKNNFYIGQFYDNTELIYASANTNGNENQSKPGGSLNNPFVSGVNQVIIPAFEVGNPAVQKIQKMIFTVSKNQVARMFLSSREGDMFPAALPKTAGFTGTPTGYFSNWYTDAKLTLGNVTATATDVKNAPSDFTICTDSKSIAANPQCAANSRYWKGKVYLVAIYCNAIDEKIILGDRSNMQVQNKVIPVDINVKVTDTLKQAQDIYQRLTSVKVPLYDPVLVEMEKRLIQNDPIGAAALATQDSKFYNITVRDFAAKMSNRAETINVPLNDFTATVIGAVRDDINAQRLLWDNITYVGDTKIVAVPANVTTDILRSNNHYLALDNQRIDLSKVLKQTTQKIFNGTTAVDMPTPAGLLSSRTWMSEHAIAGTNRRLVEYSLREFLCTPLESVADSTGPDNVVARDIDRFPGGVHTKFTTTCRACHTIMDGFRPAFSQFTFNNDYVMHTFTSPSAKSTDDEAKGLGILRSKESGATFVHDKLNKNESVFPGGRITVDDNWVNNASYGANTNYFSWTKLKGKGIQDFGKMLSESKQFPICMAKRVYASVCKREPASSDQNLINTAATEFSTSRNYSLKFLFQKIVTSKECLGGK